MDKLDLLKQYFGHESFRGGQENVIDALLAGRDALAIMPTGGGKSLCYQIPALLLRGVTLVVSPLISLMKDQVAALTDSGVAAAYINSSLSEAQMSAVYRNLRRGAYKIVYVAPERLTGEGFVALCRQLDLSLLAVDEAHCISQWGQDFRPSYLKISEFLAQLPRRPVLAAFTATATEAVRKDIAQILGLQNPLCMITGFDRPNLFFDVLQPQKRSSELRRLIAGRSGKSGIVYCATRATVERVCADLKAHGVPAVRYHAGLEDAERQQNQDDFQYDRASVMVATNAFGMGIDKSNVSYVIHYNMPKSIEAYYQEAGRAGRDGEPADCILLYSPADILTAKMLLQSSSENETLDPESRRRIQEQDLRRLEAMIGYCTSSRCLRGVILDYFGQPHAQQCGNCGICRSTFRQQDITTQAQMILSCVLRIHKQLGYYVGYTLVVRTLSGSREQRVQNLSLDKLSTYGLLRQYSRAQIRTFIDELVRQGYLQIQSAHQTLEPTERSRAVLFENARVTMFVRFEIAPQRSTPISLAPEMGEVSPALLLALKSERARIAQEEHIPPYIVFSNAVLTAMAARRPHSAEEFLSLSGVGEKKAARYGAAFLSVIASYEETEQEQT